MIIRLCIILMCVVGSAHGVAATFGTFSSDNPSIPETPDLSGILTRDKLLREHEARQVQEIADAVYEKLKSESVLKATQKGMLDTGQPVLPAPQPAKPAQPVLPAQQVLPAQATSPVQAAPATPPVVSSELQTMVTQEIDQVFNDPILNQKRISLDTQAIDIKKLVEMIGRLSGLTILVDAQISGQFGPLHIKDKTTGALLRLIAFNFSPKLALVKQSDDVWKLVLYSEAEKELKKDSEGKIVQKVFPINHAKVNSKFTNHVEAAWNSINQNQKDPTKFLRVDEEERKVLVRGHPVAVQELYKFLFEIDKPIIQVRIDAILVLTEKSFDFEFGVDWSGIYNRQETMEQKNGSGFWGTGARLTDFPTPTSSPENIKNNSNLLVDPTNFAVNLFSSINSLIEKSTSFRGVTDLIKIPFVFGGPDLNLKRLNLVLNAAETHQKLKIISRPTVLTSNNEIAELLIGESIPLQTAIEDVTTSNTRNITTINYKNTGVVLQVKPTVSSDGKNVTLDILVEDSQVTSGNTIANSQGVMEDPPTITILKAKNTVVLRSGETTIIGGLSGNTNRSIGNKVPILSRLPFVGKLLFQSNFDLNSDKERFIFITPTVIET